MHVNCPEIRLSFPYKDEPYTPFSLSAINATDFSKCLPNLIDNVLRREAQGDVNDRLGR